MKEVKFRVWCKDNKEWEKDNCLLTENGELLHQIRQGAYMLLRPENHIVSFYTGLKDKNGKEIYEGDIIMNSNNDRIAVVAFGEFETFFRDNYYGWYLKAVQENRVINYVSTANTSNFIVAGNIYENPELLEGLK